MQESGPTKGEPLPAATVVILREAPARPEVLMVRRHSSATFGASHVFPGGVLDSQDRSAHVHCQNVSAKQADLNLGVDRHGLDYYSAAIREVFEETGVMLARGASGEWAFSDKSMTAADIDEIRRRLNENEERWPDILARCGWKLACDSLNYFAFWLTPSSAQRRFSTRFFVAVLPDGQDASHNEGELTDSCWITAADALIAANANEIKLIHPTYSTLKDIAHFESVREIVNWARQRAESGVARLLPAFVEVDGEDRLVMPVDPHYPQGGVS